jgi:hypothetical protein
MKPEDNRRAFIVSAACGVPLLAVGSAAAFAESFRSPEHTHAATPAPDPLVEHVDERLAAVLRDVLNRGTALRADEARTAAAHLQILAVHAAPAQLNDRARRLLQRRIASTGREAVAREPLDLAHVRALLNRRGVTLPPRLADASIVNIEHRQAAIELVLAGRTSTAFAHMAATLDALAPRLPDVDGVLLDIRQSSVCEFLLSQWVLYFGLAGLFCGNLAYDVDLQMWCEALWQGALIADLAYWSNC